MHSDVTLHFSTLANVGFLVGIRVLPSDNLASVDFKIKTLYTFVLQHEYGSKF